MATTKKTDAQKAKTKPPKATKAKAPALEVPLTGEEQPDNACVYCSGTGTNECHECRGDGIVDCEDCCGTGQV